MFWVGGYGPDMNGTGTGIGRMVSRADGSLEYTGVVVETPSPSYLAQGSGHIYSVDEGRGTVSSFVASGDGLVADGTVESSGRWPCHVAFLGDALVVANYFTGTLATIGLAPDGAMSGPLQTLSSPARDGHAHSSVLAAPGLLVSADLGADRLLLHSIADGAVTRTGEVGMPAGTGPRDLVIHESGLLYVLGEHGGTVTIYEPVDWMLEPVASASVPGFEAGSQCAALAFGADGYLYAGVRGANRVAVLSVSADGRQLEPVAAVDCEGDHPRHLTVSDGVLHVANQNTNAVASFRLGRNGLPELIREPEFVPSPTFLLKAA